MQTDAKNASDKRYRESPEGRKANDRYFKSEKGRAAAKRYRESPEGRASHRRYEESEKGRKTVNARNKRYRESPEGRESGYRYKAKTRGLEFALSSDEFLLLTQSDCHYCGGPGYGVDRVDSDRGYLLDNCVPCCSLCNRLKGAEDYDEFVAQVLLIAAKLR